MIFLIELLTIQAYKDKAAASTIQWHILGMFTPSFFTGFLIARFGVLTMILCDDIGLNMFCVAINLSGTGS